MSIFDSMRNSIGAFIGGAIAPYLQDAIGVRAHELSNYYTGIHPPQLRIKQNKQTGAAIDDNLYMNLVALTADRSVSRLFGSGLEWELPEGADEQKAYLDRVWELNKKAITLHQFGLWGASNGTPYIKIRPDALIDPYTEKLCPSLIVLNSEIVRIETDPQDMDEVLQYKIQYNTREVREGKESDIVHIEIIRHSREDDYRNEGGEVMETPDTWIIEEFERVGSASMQLVRSEVFPYNFAPIIHCKNLPRLNSPYGKSDYENVIGLQNKINFNGSNIGKIIKHHASQRPVGTGFSVDDVKSVDDSPDSMLVVSKADAKVFLLEGQSDLTASRLYWLDLQKSFFEITREIHPSVIADKLGAITNLGLRILFMDALDKNKTKQELYGGAILELNRRLLVMAGWELEASNPGTLRWGEALPVNIMEEMQADKIAQDSGWIDRETIARRYEKRYGVDWETIQANIAAQKEADNATNSNVGAMILRNFNQGQ